MYIYSIACRDEFDHRFEAGEDISDFVDWKAARRPALEARRVNVVLLFVITII